MSGPVMDLSAASVWFTNEIDTKTAWAAGKIGTSEFNILIWYIKRKTSVKLPYPDHFKRDIFVNAGLWVPNGQQPDAFLDDWAAATIEAIKLMDGLANWSPQYLKHEAAFIRDLNPTAKTFVLRALEPFYTPDNQYTTKMTKGTVAVVSPFAETIMHQLPRMDAIFPSDGPAGQMWLANQKIKPIKAYYGPNMTPSKPNLSWSKTIQEAGPLAAVNALADQITADATIRYALVGIGAISLLLVAELKRRGLVAIHTGGGTQIMFGVKGRRWDNHSVISKFYNHTWTRPSLDEIPTEALKIEGACYW